MAQKLAAAKGLSRLLALFLIISIGLVQAKAQEVVRITTSKIKDLNLRLYGFVETDLISDSTQSFNEEQGNNLVQKNTASGGGADNYAGKHHRAQMGIRNSRLGFDLTLPKTDAGLQTHAVIELDFMGNNATNTQPGTGPGTQTERDFFNNPAVRVRHAYLNLTYNEWNAKAGQYWSLLGWQPYYFPGESVVQPGVGQLYRRFAQIRAMNSHPLNEEWLFETAADVAKPAEMNSGVPEFHGGLRLSSTKYKAANVGGAGSSMVGLSAALSGAIIPVRSSVGSANGEAATMDLFIPIIPSQDGKDKSNNLSLTGEIMSGRGVGGLEYSGLAMGVPAVTAAVAGTAIDSGIAGINANGNLELVRYRALRSNLQYTLPGARWTASAGYAQVEGRNLDRFATSVAANNLLCPKIQYGYVSLFYDPLSWLRFATEFNQTRDTYNDPANRHAVNNRLQFTTFFVF